MADYNTLISDLQNWMENPSAEYTASIPAIIRLSEARLFRDLNVTALDHVVTGTIAEGVPSVSTPVDLIQPRHLRIRLSDGSWRILQMKELEYILEYAPDDSDDGTPVYYAIETDENYRIAPVPDDDYDYSLAYKRILPSLGTASPENWLTRRAYDCLFAACMAESGRFVLDDRQNTIISLWEQKYAELVAAINGVEIRSERDDFRTAPNQIDNR